MIYDSLPLGTNRATLTSRNSASVRCADYGRDARPVAKIEEYTESAAARIRAAEDAMISAMKGTNPQAPAGGARWSEARHMEAQRQLLGHLDTPKTAQQLSKLMLKSENSVLTCLKRLRDAEFVAVGDPVKLDNGMRGGRLWRRLVPADTPVPQSDWLKAQRERGDRSRIQALEALTRPMSASELASITGRRTECTLKYMRHWVKQGRVRSIGSGAGKSQFIFERIEA